MTSPSARPARAAAATGRLVRATQAEGGKLLGLRSTLLILGSANLLGLVLGVMSLRSTADAWSALSAADRSAFDPTADAFSGFQYTQLALAAWGVSAVTSEYAHGTLGSTFMAVPRRGTVFTAKLAVVTCTALPLSLVSVALTWVSGQLVLRGRGLDVGISDPGVVRALLGASLFLTVVTVLGSAIGALVRHTAVALTVMVGLLFLAWPAARAMESVSYLPDRWLLVNAADALVTTRPITGPNALRTPGTWAAIIEISVYLIVFLGLGAQRFRRDP